MIFLSSDKSAEEMAAYRAAEHGDWLALEHADRAARDALAERYGVGSIPALVVIEQGRKVRPRKPKVKHLERDRDWAFRFRMEVPV